MESVKNHHDVMWVVVKPINRSENQIMSILHISEEEAVIFQKLLFLNPDPFHWVSVCLSLPHHA